MKRALAAGAFLALAVLSTSQQRPREQVGPLPDGGFLLNNGWRIHPAGKQIPLDTMPMASVLEPGGRFLIVMNGGYNPPSLSVVDLQNEREIQRIAVPDAWLGMALAANGKTLWVGGGSTASIYEFALSDAGKLEAARTFPLVPPAERKWEDFIGDVALAPDGHLLYAAELYRNRILVVNPQSGRVIETFDTARRPYRILFHPDGKSFFVTSWADGTLTHHDAASGSRLETLHVGMHPTDIVWSDKPVTAENGEAPAWKARLFVTAANTNNVYSVAVSETGELKPLETINLSMTPRQPVGMTPSAAGLSADRNKLYVACSDANAVAAVDISQPRSQVEGFIPTGWYPTAVRALSDGRLVVLNGRGLRSFANPNGPSPIRRPEPVHEGLPNPGYVGRLQKGTASIVEPLNEERLHDYTAEVFANSPYKDSELDGVTAPPNSPVPARPGATSPIQHVLYIVKENRTYDQVLGDIGKGESDPSLILFNSEVGPNHHKLAREFVLLDNFYVNADVSADGHAWSTSAIATDYIQKMWPNSYAKRRNHYDYEESDPASLPPAGYLWTNAAQRGLTMRNYGYSVSLKAHPGEDGLQIESVRDPILARCTNMKYRGFDLAYEDVKRAKTFLDDLKEFEANNSMPQFMIMRLGNDHTNGTAAGKIAPLSSFAD